MTQIETQTGTDIAVIPPGGAVAVAAGNIGKYLAEVDPQATIGKLIKFSKGEYLKGMDGDVVPMGSMFAVAPDFAATGYIRWEDGKPAEHKIVRIASGEPIPDRAELGHHDQSLWEKDATDKPRDPWQGMIYLPMMSADGELCTFTTSSKSGMKSVRRVLRAYATHSKRRPDQYPLIKLGVGYFMHDDKAIGKVFYPEFEPAGYVNRAEFIEALEAVGVAGDGEAPPPPKNDLNDAIPF